MIVKNESRIILRLLESVVSFIDSYCICDTGSTDNTIEIITHYFLERGIRGKTWTTPFRDFGYNRTLAIRACEGMPNADYILLLDADMQLQIQPNITPLQLKKQLTDDLYFVFQGNECLYYKNVRIVKNNRGITYWGVTHEFVKTPESGGPFTYGQFDKSVLFINDVGDGGAKSDKYTRDIALLKQGLVELPNNDRYLFYLANSYRDTGQFELAIETYKRRIAVGGWFEEIWHSHYSIGKCAKQLGKIELAMYHWLEGHNVFPQRLENMYEIIRHYRENTKYDLAYHFYVMMDDERKRFKGALDFLFLEKDVYDWKLDYEMTVIAFYRNTLPYDIPTICMKVLNYPLLDHGIVANIMSNYKFYSPQLLALGNTIVPTHTDFVHVDFVNSTPSFCYNASGQLISLVRYVNYRIREDGSYENRSTIETRNILSTIDVSSNQWMKRNETETLLKYDTTRDNVYVGLEDMRLFLHDGTVVYTANRGLSHDKIAVEFGKINTENGSTYDSVVLQGENAIEKNWVLFEDMANRLLVVHSWHPLTIGYIAWNQTWIKMATLPSPPCLRNVRGSTNGQKIGDEIWFVCHCVSHEIRRYYYHLFVVLDATTFHVKRFSPFFTLEKKCVEYCLGLLYNAEKDTFWVGYSLLDRETKYMEISRSVINFL
jgi:glycosyltransferase involved in cell wall biosynthesis